MGSDELGEDENTVIELGRDDIVSDGEFDTPTTMPRCVECGTVVFLDEFTVAASIVAQGIFNSDRCVRALDGHWWWCHQKRKVVYFVP